MTPAKPSVLVGETPAQHHRIGAAIHRRAADEQADIRLVAVDLKLSSSLRFSGRGSSEEASIVNRPSASNT